MLTASRYALKVLFPPCTLLLVKRKQHHLRYHAAQVRAEINVLRAIGHKKRLTASGEGAIDSRAIDEPHAPDTGSCNGEASPAMSDTSGPTAPVEASQAGLCVYEYREKKGTDNRHVSVISVAPSFV